MSFLDVKHLMKNIFHFHVFYTYRPRKYTLQYFIIYILYVFIVYVHKIRENEK